jgi:2-oxo-4-hydroxy-4-carboxy-5-ureidoimidazoline decarboxylase
VNAEPQPRLLAISHLNQLAADEFASALNPLFEAAAPLATALWSQRPFASYADLIDHAESLASRLPVAQQIEVVTAHPRIGERADHLSVLSLREQGYGSNDSDAERMSIELADLNAAYEHRFGFRFLVFVDKRPKSAIVEVLRERMNNSPETELRTALRDMFLIARDRLSSMNDDR